MKGVRSLSFFLSFFLHVTVQLFQYHLSKSLSFHHCIASFQKSVGYINVALFLGSVFGSIDLLAYSFTKIILSWSMNQGNWMCSNRRWQE